ncbi:MAG TPA: 3-hydroxybutyryl-CoA dehydrogenase [Candidatus Krumholzibacteria bacterium]|jgi:3-hydroxybutyryl-CoA dehydrogenase|nr:3-hydroxybutyryl-CoA dehydrogenase [Candidatus Krumholzibacteria bacterium]
MEIHQVGVVGAGTMGSGIAQAFALGGHPVGLVDSDGSALDRAMQGITKSMDRLVRKETIGSDVAHAALGRIVTARDLSRLHDCALVVEAVFENFAVKRQIFQELDALLPPAAIVASNTSSISITALAATTGRPERVVGMHFFNPVPMMKLVEIIRGETTSDAVCAAVVGLARSLGKTPVEVRDYPGFVSNRVLMPMLNEAMFCLQEGVAERDAIDTVLKLGMAHPMGPLQLADFIGLDVCLDIMNVLYEGFGDSKYRPCPLLKRMVAAGRLGKKSGRGFYDYTEQRTA